MTPQEPYKNRCSSRSYTEKRSLEMKNMRIKSKLGESQENINFPGQNFGPSSGASYSENYPLKEQTNYNSSTMNTKSKSHSNNSSYSVNDDGIQQYKSNQSSLRFIMTVLGCSFGLAGSQLVALLYFTLAPRIAKDLDAVPLTSWLLSSGIISMGAAAPFVGPIADLFGRKPIFLLGIILAIIGAVICAITPNAAGFIAGQTLLGLGGVIEELMALSIVTEIVPTEKRGLYAAMILGAILPWTPGTLYADFMAESSWRWIGCPLALWHLLVLAIIACFYFPPPRTNSRGRSYLDLIKEIDWIGGFFLILGSLLFLIALNWGGLQYPWTSFRVLSFLLIGIGLYIIFGIWEKFGAKNPLYPMRILQAPRAFICIMLVIFSAGINYIPLVVFWPIEAISVYGADLRQSGIYSLPIGMCIIGGAIVSAVLIGLFKPYVTVIMTIFCLLQTSASASMAAADPHNVSTILAPLCIALVGVGGVLVPNQIIITILTPDDLIASATALTVAVRSQAQVIGLALFFSRFQRVLEKNAIRHVAMPIISAGVFNITVIKDLVLGLATHPFDELAAKIPQLSGPAHIAAFNAVKEGTIQTYKASFDYIYLINIGFGVAACIAAAAMGNIEQYMDEHVAVVM